MFLPELKVESDSRTKVVPARHIKSQTVLTGFTDTGKNESPEITTPESDDNEAGKKLILIVEDNADVRDFINDSIDEDYNVLLAENGKEGLELAISKVPDIIITDLMMPVLDGLEMTRKIKNTLETSHIPVIMLTARGATDNKIEGLDTGADAYLVKPFAPNELNAHIRNLVKQRERLQQFFTKNISQITENKEAEGFLSLQDKKFLQLINTLLEANLSDDGFDVEQLCEKIKISRSGLFRKLKNLTGYSPSQYIRNFRLDKAVEMLKTENLTISEISYRVGFSSVNYFNRCFKERYLVTPKEYGYS